MAEIIDAAGSGSNPTLASPATNGQIHRKAKRPHLTALARFTGHPSCSAQASLRRFAGSSNKSAACTGPGPGIATRLVLKCQYPVPFHPGRESSVLRDWNAGKGGTSSAGTRPNKTPLNHPLKRAVQSNAILRQVRCWENEAFSRDFGACRPFGAVSSFCQHPDGTRSAKGDVEQDHCHAQVRDAGHHAIQIRRNRIGQGPAWVCGRYLASAWQPDLFNISSRTGQGHKLCQLQKARRQALYQFRRREVPGCRLNWAAAAQVLAIWSVQSPNTDECRGL